MSDVQLGQLAPTDADRDATHVAVVPMVAAHQLMPGVHVGIIDDGRAAVEGEPKIGIVDPFLVRPVDRGERFYLCLYPRSVTGLRHVYTHPVLDAAHTASKVQRQASEQWLRDFCATRYMDYEVLVAAAIGDHQKNYGEDGYFNSCNYGEYLHFGGRDAHGEIPPELWDHVENVTGRKVQKRATYFSCSC